MFFIVNYVGGFTYENAQGIIQSQAETTEGSHQETNGGTQKRIGERRT